MEKIKRTLGFIFTHPLGGKHPVKALFRFLLWQLQSGLSPSKLLIKPFVSPVKFYARKGLTGITGNIYTGLHEFNDMGFLLHFLRPGDIFFDIGANVGSYTLLASGVCGAESYAIEPVASTFDLLRRNIDLNKLTDKVTLINAGAGSEKGVLTFSSNEDTTNHVISEEDVNNTNVTSVPVITIDSLFKDAKPVLIKIDVEGFETEVLKGMRHTVASTELNAIIIELNGSGARYGYNETDVHNLLLSENFLPFNYDPFTRLLTEIPTFGSANTIYCRDTSFITQRLKDAKATKIMGRLI
jgi:FkbM family methyltransferase